MAQLKLREQEDPGQASTSSRHHRAQQTKQDNSLSPPPQAIRRASPAAYLSGMKRDELVAPIPGRPCVTGLYEMANSPR